MRLMTEVFSRGLWIHHRPSSSCERCSRAGGRVGEGQPRQAAEDEDVADAGQPVVELLAGQQFQFMRRKVLFGLHLVLFEFIVAERIFRDPLVAQAVEDEVCADSP